MMTSLPLWGTQMLMDKTGTCSRYENSRPKSNIPFLCVWGFETLRHWNWLRHRLRYWNWYTNLLTTETLKWWFAPVCPTVYFWSNHEWNTVFARRLLSLLYSLFPGFFQRLLGRAHVQRPFSQILQAIDHPYLQVRKVHYVELLLLSAGVRSLEKKLFLRREIDSIAFFCLDWIITLEEEASRPGLSMGPIWFFMAVQLFSYDAFVKGHSSCPTSPPGLQPHYSPSIQYTQRP